MESMKQLQEHLKVRPLELQRMRKQGIKVIGYAPGGYMPEELVYAAGAVPVGLLSGGTHEPVAESGAYVPRFLDTFCRSQIGCRMLGENPLYQLIDLIVVPITDNNMRAVADAWNFYTDVDVFRFGVPHDKEEEAFEYYLDGLQLLKGKLEAVTGNEVDEGKLRKATATSNEMWNALREISMMRRSPTPPISGKDFVRLNHASYYAEKSVLVNCLKTIQKELKGKKGECPKARILLVGSTLAMGDYKVFDIAEAAGAAIVIEEFAEGIRHYWQVIEPNGDLMRALAERYFRRRVPPAWARPSREHMELAVKLARDFKVDGVIWYQLMYRDGYDIQSFYFEKLLEKETGLSMLKIQSDYDASEVGPLETRVETFIETIKRR